MLKDYGIHIGVSFLCALLSTSIIVWPDVLCPESIVVGAISFSGIWVLIGSLVNAPVGAALGFLGAFTWPYALSVLSRRSRKCFLGSIALNLAVMCVSGIVANHHVSSGMFM